MNVSKVVCTMEFYDGDEIVLKKIWTEQLERNLNEETKINYSKDTLFVTEQWENIKREMQKALGISEVSYKTWIEPLKIFKIEQNTVFVSTPLKASVSYIVKKFATDIQGYVSLITGQEYLVEIICPN